MIESQLASGPTNKRVGLVGLERIPVREGAALVDASGHALGSVTSGTIAPSVDRPIAMAYLPVNHAALHGEVRAMVRNKPVPMRISTMPFHPHRYHRA